MKKSEVAEEVEESEGTNKRQKWDSEIIIGKGRELFSEKGFDLSMRDIAKALNTRASSLYRHVQSKRELWFAIINKDYDDFTLGMREIIQENESEKPIKLLKIIGEYFLDFARADFNRFKIMFLYEPPREEAAGPYEQACKPDSLSYLVQACQAIIETENLTKIQAKELSILVYSELLGYTIITSPINDYLLEQKEFSYIKEPSFDQIMLDKMIEGIYVFK